MLQAMWALLLTTLPTQPNAVRLRVWRALKAAGCASLRDGAYLLPETHAATLDAVAAEVSAHGGSAHVLLLAPRNDSQRDAVLRLFDRSEAYAAWGEAALSLQAQLATVADAGETALRRSWQQLAEALASLQRTDHYPGPAAAQAQQSLARLHQAIDARCSRGEPGAAQAQALPRLDRADFQARRWATRARPWADRLASAWLIRRFIDPQARWIWLPDDGRPLRTPRGAVGFDYDGARFSHVGPWVTFEVLARQFGLDGDPALQRLAQLVHGLDTGGLPLPETAGLAAVLGGLRQLHTDDDALVLAAAAVFDALLAAPASRPA